MPDSWDIPGGVETPLDAFPNDIASDDLVCQETGCEEPLFYSGRGRKPKFCDEHKRTKSSGTGTRRSNANLETAMASLSTAENGILIPLMLISPVAAQAWDSSLPALRERNRAILAAQPDLCKKIVGAGAKVGPGALIVSYLVAVAPVVAIAMGERKAAKPKPATQPRNAPQQPQRPTSVPDPTDIDSIAFGSSA